MKDYYKILEVDKSATKQEIKTAYRSLAKKYHPDKSSSIHALQLFTEVNEAYEVLSNSNQKLTYDQRSKGNYQREFSRRAYRPQKTPSVDLNPYVPYFRAVSIIGLAISFFLSVDFLLPRKIVSEKIINLENVIASNRAGQRFLVAIKVTTENEIYEISEDLNMGLFIDQSVEIQKTQLLSITTSVDFSREDPSDIYYMAASIYHNFSFAWIALLITSIVGTMLKKSAEMILNLSIVNGFLLMLVIYFAVIS